MRIMISMSMINKTNEHIKNRFAELTKEFSKYHIEVVNSFFEEDAPDEYYTPGLYFMGKSIDLMGKVDAIYFDKGWSESTGCQVERMIANRYGIKILPDNFLDDPIIESVKLFADGVPIREYSVMDCSDTDQHTPNIY